MKNIAILIFVMVIMFGTESYSATGFEKTVGGQDDDRGVFVSPTRDGGYIAVGVTSSYGEGQEDVYLVKTDSAGEVQWTKTYGGPENDQGWSVRETPDGYVIAGFTQSFGNGEFDFYLIKTDLDGESKWSETYGGEGNDRCWAFALTNDGGFVLAGETTSMGAGKEDFCLVKADSLGVFQWSKTYGGKKDDRCFSVLQTDDGGYMLAGQTFSLGAGDRDVYVVKTKADGEMEWSKVFGGPGSDVGHSITTTRDGNFLVTGYTSNFAAEADDPYLIKFDAKGITQWTSVLPLEGINHTLTGEQATDKTFYLVGFTQHPESGSKTALLV
jgi:hypothetical protein